MKTVFLASRFEEFSEIRKKIKDELLSCSMEAIDLNDNMAVAHAPIERSLQKLRQSDIVILLVGDSYGSIPSGKSKSYTHLEYCEAVNENKPVYVFCIGKSYSDGGINYSNSEDMKKWQKELEKTYTLSMFDGTKNIDHIVHEIIKCIYREQRKVWIDDETGLMWQVQLNDIRYQWNDIFKYKDKINNDNYGECNDWRVPTFDELESLNTEEGYRNTYGFDEESFIKKDLLYSMTMEYGRFWSKTSNKKDNNLAFGINFNRKRKNSLSKKGNKEKSKTRHIRCVRLHTYIGIEEEWIKIESFPEIENIESFLKKYPHSKYKDKAQKILDKLRENEKKDFQNLSILEQKLFTLYKKNPNTPKSTSLLKSIEEGTFDTEKYEALLKLQRIIQEEGKWKENSTAKNQLKDKDYQKTIKVMELINECK